MPRTNTLAFKSELHVSSDYAKMSCNDQHLCLFFTSYLGEKSYQEQTPKLFSLSYMSDMTWLKCLPANQCSSLFLRGVSDEDEKMRLISDKYEEICRHLLQNYLAVVKIEMATKSIIKSRRDKKFSFENQLSTLGNPFSR